MVVTIKENPLFNSSISCTIVLALDLCEKNQYLTKGQPTFPPAKKGETIRDEEEKLGHSN